MNDQDIEALKYPTGKFVRGTRAATAERVAECTAVIDAFPQQLRAAVEGWSDHRLDTPYRPARLRDDASAGERVWTVRQLVHHLADSHGQSLHRFKLALTEESPVIKPYKEALWAENVDARTMPLDPSLWIVAGCHARWVVLLRNMSGADFDREFFHPEQQRAISLAEALELYVWHGRHHLAHITGLKQRMGW